MKRFITGDLIQSGQQKFQSKVLTNAPGFRILLLSLKAGHIIPEHASRERVTIVALRGQVRFSEGELQTDLFSDDVLLLETGSLHRVEALQDSALLVVATSTQTGAGADELDLRGVARALRHPLVFKHLDSLSLQQSVVVVNDHDPVPLLQQIAASKPDEMEWEYLERGPEFRIRIRRVSPPMSVPAGSAS